MATPNGPSTNGRADSDRLRRAGDGALDDRLDGELGRPEGLDVLEQLVLDLLADDQDDAVEAGGDGVAGGEVHDRLAGGTDRRELFQAAEPAPVAGCEYDELHD